MIEQVSISKYHDRVGEKVDFIVIQRIDQKGILKYNNNSSFVVSI